MGLLTRISVLIVTLFVVVCIAAGAYVVDNARRAVTADMNAKARLTLDLLEAELVRGGAVGDPVRLGQFLDRLATMESTRHLRIAVRAPGAGEPLTGMRLQAGRTIDAPAWFTRLVAPEGVTARRLLSEPGIHAMELELLADPADEIAEAWSEARSVLVLMIVFTAMVMGLIYFRLGRDLSPIDSILRGLEGIERGEYQLRLPAFATSELGRISNKFNHMAQVLMESRAENRRLSQGSLQIQEQERRHIARELHDELGQSLTAIKAMAVASAATPAEPGRLRASMEEIARIADHTYGVARQLMQRLRPPVLDVLGLAAALQDLVDRWNSANGEGFCRLALHGDTGMLSDAVRISLYRIIQEALTNVARHGHADQVDVSLRVGGAGEVELVVADDGAGFEQPLARPGLGLLGMRERVAALGGEFALVTAPGRGTRIRITLPAVAESAA